MQKASRLATSPAPAGTVAASDSYTVKISPPESIVMVTSVSVSQRRQTSATTTAYSTMRLHLLNKKTNRWQAICPSYDHFYNVNEVGLLFSTVCFSFEIFIAVSHGTAPSDDLKAQQPSAYPVAATVRLTVIALSNHFPQGTLTTRLSDDMQKSDGFNPTSGCDAAFACDGSGGVLMAFQVDSAGYGLLCSQLTTPGPSSALELTAAQLGGLAGGIAGGAVLICVAFYFGVLPLPLVMTDIHKYIQTHKQTHSGAVVRLSPDYFFALIDHACSLLLHPSIHILRRTIRSVDADECMCSLPLAPQEEDLERPGLQGRPSQSLVKD